MQVTIQVKSNSLGDSVFEIAGDTNIASTKHQHAEIADLLSEVIHTVCSIYSIPKGLIKLETHTPRSQREPKNRSARTEDRNEALASLDSTSESEEFIEYSEDDVRNALHIVQLLKGITNSA